MTLTQQLQFTAAVDPLDASAVPTIARNSRNALLALQFAGMAAQDFDAYFAIRDEQREQLVPVFDAQELTIQKNPCIRTSGFCAEYALESVQLLKEEEDIDVTTTAADDTTLTTTARQRFQSRFHKDYYVVKRLQRHLIDTDHGPNAAAEFVVETKLLMNLSGNSSHPNLCRIYGLHALGIDSFLSPNNPFFIITDRLTESLTDRIERWRNNNNSSVSTAAATVVVSSSSSSTLNERLEIALDMASALAFLHDRHVVYYLMPDKVGFAAKSSGGLKLCHFSQCRSDGMTELPRSITKSDAVTQVLAYTAPEVILASAPAMVASDAYAFAILVWELLTLERPFGNCCRDRSQHYERVVLNQERPSLERLADENLKQLLSSGWDNDTHVRPTINTIRERIEQTLLYGTENTAAELMIPPVRHPLKLKLHKDPSTRSIRSSGESRCSGSEECDGAKDDEKRRSSKRSSRSKQSRDPPAVSLQQGLKSLRIKQGSVSNRERFLAADDNQSIESTRSSDYDEAHRHGSKRRTSKRSNRKPLHASTLSLQQGLQSLGTDQGVVGGEFLPADDNQSIESTRSSDYDEARRHGSKRPTSKCSSRKPSHDPPTVSLQQGLKSLGIKQGSVSNRERFLAADDNQSIESTRSSDYNEAHRRGSKRQTSKRSSRKPSHTPTSPEQSILSSEDLPVKRHAQHNSTAFRDTIPSSPQKSIASKVSYSMSSGSYSASNSSKASRPLSDALVALYKRDDDVDDDGKSADTTPTVPSSSWLDNSGSWDPAVTVSPGTTSSPIKGQNTRRRGSKVSQFVPPALPLSSAVPNLSKASPIRQAPRRSQSAQVNSVFWEGFGIKAESKRAPLTLSLRSPSQQDSHIRKLAHQKTHHSMSLLSAAAGGFQLDNISSPAIKSKGKIMQRPFSIGSPLPIDLDIMCSPTQSVKSFSTTNFMNMSPSNANHNDQKRRASGKALREMSLPVELVKTSSDKKHREKNLSRATSQSALGSRRRLLHKTPSGRDVPAGNTSSDEDKRAYPKSAPQGRRRVIKSALSGRDLVVEGLQVLSDDEVPRQQLVRTDGGPSRVKGRAYSEEAVDEPRACLQGSEFLPNSGFTASLRAELDPNFSEPGKQVIRNKNKQTNQ